MNGYHFAIQPIYKKEGEESPLMWFTGGKLVVPLLYVMKALCRLTSIVALMWRWNWIFSRTDFLMHQGNG